MEMVVILLVKLKLVGNALVALMFSLMFAQRFVVTVFVFFQLQINVTMAIL